MPSLGVINIYTASLGRIADFLVSLFGKNGFVPTIRGYRSAIASFHAGFPDGSTVYNIIHPSSPDF